jgi:hypothetical protein
MLKADHLSLARIDRRQVDRGVDRAGRGTGKDRGAGRT